MRIVYLLLHDFRFASSSFRDFAGPTYHFSKEYARRMAELGHEVALYTFGVASGKKVLELDGYRLKGFSTAFRFPPLIKFGNDHSIEVLRELSEDRPDIVHFHNYYLWNFPYVAPWAKRRGAKLVAQFHGTDPIRRLKGVGYYPSIRLCDGILVPTRGEEKHLTRGLRIPSDRVHLFPSTGVDAELFHDRGHGGVRFNLLYAGRIPAPTSYRWEKAPLYLLPILRELRRKGVDARLTVAGEGPGLPGLRELAMRLGLDDAVRFLGALGQERLPQLYSQSDLSFSPIHMDDIEPFWGGTVQESLACGTPVVAFNDRNPGFRKFGLLIPSKPSRAAEILAVALNQPEKLSEARSEGPSYVSTNCSWDSLTSRLDRLYRGIAS